MAFTATELHDLEVGNAMCFSIFAEWSGLRIGSPDGPVHGMRYKSGEINIFATRDTEPRTIEEIIQEYSLPACPKVVWWVGPSSSDAKKAHLPPHLMSLGFELDPATTHTSIMAIRTSRLPEPTSQSPSFQVVEILDDEALAKRVRAEIIGFKDGEFSESAYTAYLGSYIAQGYRPGKDWRHFAALQEEEIIGTASIVFYGSIGFISGVSVIPNARRKGLATALTRYCLELARTEGVDVVGLGQDSRDAKALYTKMGFVDACCTQFYERITTK